MPTQTNNFVHAARASHDREYHAVVSGHCATSMTREVDVFDYYWNDYAKTKARTWVNSSPWPVPEGQLKIVNPYSVTIEETRRPMCTWGRLTQEIGGACYSLYSYRGQSPTDGACNATAPALIADRKYWLIGQAALALLLAIKNQQSQIAVSLAEGRQTVNMIASMARDLAGIRTRWLKKQPRKIRRDERSLHSSWLEYRYGWMPLYYDAYGIAKHLSGLTSPIQERHRVSVSRDWNSDSSASAFWNGFLWKGNYVTRTSHRYVARAGCLVIIEHRVSREAARAGLTNPLELLWEVLPYSFVVDWFVRVGDYIEGMTALQGVTVDAGYQSFMADRATARSPISTTYPVNMVDLNHPQYVGRRIDYDRWKATPSLLSVDLSSLVNFDLSKQSWKHYVDGIALFKAAFRER